MKTLKILSENIQKIQQEISFPDPADPIGELIIDLCKSVAGIPPYLCFYKIINPAGYIFIADYIRGIPLFYTVKDNFLYVSDKIDDLLPFSGKEIDSEAISEFRQTGFTTGSSTLLTDIKQLQAGEFLALINGEIRTGFYHRYLINASEINNTNIQEFESVLKSIFDDLVVKLNGRTAVIPLSGGYDSRLIAFWLKKLNYRNIFSFTYGRAGNIEIENAEKAAEKLSIPWIFIDYSKLPLKDYLETEEFKNYYRISGNYSSMFFMQDYFAVQYLKHSGAIPDDAVFIPGHSGDFLAGSHLNSKLNRKFSVKNLSEMLFFKYYNFTEARSKERRMLFNRIEKQIFHSLNNFTACSVFEDWVLRERQAKFIVNSSRIYSYFGYNYYLPFWDHRFIDFFRNLSFNEKLYKSFYNNKLQNLFNDYQLNFPDELQSLPKDYKTYSLKQSILSLFPFLKKFKRLDANDSICYKEITSIMAGQMKDAGIKLHRPYSYNSYIVQWYIAKITGMI